MGHVKVGVAALALVLLPPGAFAENVAFVGFTTLNNHISFSAIGQDRSPSQQELESVFFQFSAVQSAEITAPAIPGVVREGTRVTLIRPVIGPGGEGPIAIPDGSGSLIFTEQDISRISRIDRDDNVTPYLANTDGAVALAYDHNGRLIGTRAGAGLTVLAPTRSVIATVYEGKPVSATELVIDRRNGIYFTNGPNVMYLNPAGALSKVGSVTRGNGIQLSPDEKTLYVTNGPLWSAAERRPVTFVMAFDVQPDGSLNNSRPFARTGADGMAVDTDGRLYVAVPPSSYRPDEVLGVRVYNPDGRLLGTIPTGLPPNSVAFGGPDKRTLYIVGRRSGLQKIRLLSQGIQSRAK